MQCLIRRTLPRALRSQVHRSPANAVPTAHLSSTPRYAASKDDDARFQEKDQVDAERQAKDPKKMANLGEEADKKRDDPHPKPQDLATSGVKGKARGDEEPIGRNVNNKASG